MQVLREGLQAQPARTAWAMTLARLQVDRGNLAGAAQTLQYSLPAAFDNADYLGFSGHLQQRLGKGKEAAELYQAATRLAPDDGRWWLGLGLAMESEGRYDQAHAAFGRAQQCGNLSRELAALVEQKLRQ
jgi:MSHA biogenesis protein MshN